MKKIIYLFIFLIILRFVTSAPIVTIVDNEDSFFVTEKEEYFYNFLIENTLIENITKINLKMPSEFSFTSGTVGATFDATLSQNSTQLMWEQNEEPLILSNDEEEIWFKSTSNIIDSYEMSITIIDSNNQSYTTKFDILVSCENNWSCTEWSTCENKSQIRICTDTTGCSINQKTEKQSCYIECVPDWNCTEWNKCINNTQNRTCTDLNNCNTENRPTENKTCDSTCVPDWNCTEWNKCKQKEQSRICTDSNNCNTNQDKPQETQICKTTNFNLFNSIISLIGTILIITIITLIYNLFSSNKNSQ